MIETIKNDSVNVTLNTKTKQQLRLLLKHAQIIIDHRHKLNSLLSNMFNAVVTEQSHVLLTLYIADLQSILGKTGTMRKGFYISIIFLIVGVILLFVRLMASFSFPFLITQKPPPN
ncbi:hypothetical protein AU255_02130 [Methyloprofundus sedimenti]|uniref:Uncharacterized protein n=2 Tax=Methyloprofundus sedimenti TaxID=1420851 RepID=A0A1V8M5E4_9GAMM|nr:hypothetical protein AU255_02130 [Methyloprofundus sedimenti]